MKKGIGLLFLSAIMFLTLTASSCSNGTGIGGTSIGDGKVDAVEAAELRVAVGLSFNARPDLIAPSYAVSTAILTGMMLTDKSISTIPQIDEIIAKETAKLKLDPLTQQSFNDLIALIKVKVVEQMGTVKIPDSNKMVVIHDIVFIIQQTSAARLGIVK